MLDTQRVTDPGNYGFDVVGDNGSLLPISNVTVTGPDTVAIAISSTPAGTTRLRYAQNQPAGSCIGPGLQYSGGARGNLRDSDDSPSLYGYDLFNWSVSFDVPVN